MPLNLNNTIGNSSSDHPHHRAGTEHLPQPSAIPLGLGVHPNMSNGAAAAPTNNNNNTNQNNGKTNANDNNNGAAVAGTSPQATMNLGHLNSTSNNAAGMASNASLGANNDDITLQHISKLLSQQLQHPPSGAQSQPQPQPQQPFMNAAPSAANAQQQALMQSIAAAQLLLNNSSGLAQAATLINQLIATNNNVQQQPQPQLQQHPPSGTNPVHHHAAAHHMLAQPPSHAVPSAPGGHHHHHHQSASGGGSMNMQDLLALSGFLHHQPPISTNSPNAANPVVSKSPLSLQQPHAVLPGTSSLPQAPQQQQSLHPISMTQAGYPAPQAVAKAASRVSTSSASRSSASNARLKKKGSKVASVEAVPPKVLPMPYPGAVTTGEAVPPLIQPMKMPTGKLSQWSLQEIQSHIIYLQSSNQIVPKPLKLMLTDAQRREEKRTAKRAANRRSASESRARKKAFVEEMTKDNERLKRQAQILALLPDLVFAIRQDGVITFVSAQVERILQHKADALVDTNLFLIIALSTQNALKTLINDVVKQAGAMDNVDDNKAMISEDSSGSNNSRAAIIKDGNSNSNNNKNGQQLNKTKYPMGAVVKVQSRVKVDNTNNNNNNSSTNNNNVNGSSTSSGSDHDTNNLTCLSSKATSSLTDSNERNSGGSEESSGSGVPPLQEQCDNSDGDSSSEARKQSEALARNVQSHNANIKSTAMWKHKDDVIGDGVTANNAEARLSSLQHLSGGNKLATAQQQQETNSNSSDSLLTGVEEKEILSRNNGPPSRKKQKMSSNNEKATSGDSDEVMLECDAEEDEEDGLDSPDCLSTTSSSSSTNCSNETALSQQHQGNGRSTKRRRIRRSDGNRDGNGGNSRTNGKARPVPMAPTCNVCIVRSDSSTVWCEVTCSVKTRLVDYSSEPSPASTQRQQSESVPDCGNSNAAYIAPTGNNNAPAISSNSSDKDAGQLGHVNGEEGGTTTNTSTSSGSPNVGGHVEELLLCLRPIREGIRYGMKQQETAVNTKDVSNGNMFNSNGDFNSSNSGGSSSVPAPMNDSSSPTNTAETTSADVNQEISSSPVPSDEAYQEVNQYVSSIAREKKIKEEENNCIVKSAVESLMRMNKLEVKKC